MTRPWSVRRTGPVRRASAPLRLEPLESRTVPASYDPLTGVGSADNGERYVAFLPLPDPDRLPPADTSMPPGSRSGWAFGPPLGPTDTFQLHSRPGATKVIYLDFDGHTTSGTWWNNSYGASIVTPPFDIDGDSSTFSTTEEQRIAAIWARVAEDFIPFDVDVTTEDPGVAGLVDSGTGDTRWGIRVCIGGDGAWLGQPAGGVSFVGNFRSGADTGAFVFPANLAAGAEKPTAEAVSHEVGHTLGLDHDGGGGDGDYYRGHGSGETGWAPIMGVGYYRELVQWSKGEYANASNRQDDLAIITSGNGFGYRPDDHGNTPTSATPAGLNSATQISGAGVIEQRSDVDYFSFRAGAGPLSLTVRPAARGPNLDVLAELYDAHGDRVASADPLNALDATITFAVPAPGQYYLKVDGTGKGNPLDAGYTDYASLGQYTFAGTIVEPPPPEPLQVLGTAAIESPGGALTALRLTFNVRPDLATLSKDNVRVTGPTGTPVPVAKVRPVAGSNTVYDLVIRPRRLVGPGGFRVFLSPDVSTGLKKLDQNANGIDGEPDDFLGAGTYAFNSTAAGPIEDTGTPTEYPLTIPSLPGGSAFNLTDVNVRVNLAHDRLSDLAIELVSPSNRVVRLFDQQGGKGRRLRGTRFDDQAPRSLDGGKSPFTGVFRPVESLADLNGEDAAGEWRLRVTDTVAGAVGELQSWGLTVTTDAARTGLRLTGAAPVNVVPSAIVTEVKELTLEFDTPVNPVTLRPRDIRVADPTGRRVRVRSVAPDAGGTTRFQVVTAPWTKAGDYIVRVGPAVADYLGNGLDMDGNGRFLDPSDVFTTTVPIDHFVFRSNSRPATIPAGGSRTVTLRVAPSVSIESLAVGLDVRHPNVGDLRVTLISPAGTRVVLYDRSATGADFAQTILSADAASALATGSTPYSGDYRPDNPLDSLAGTGAKGKWRLQVDATGADAGSLLSWALFVKPL